MKPQEENMKSFVLLYSGGADSTVAFHMLTQEGHTVYPLYIDYGQKALRNEIKAAKFFIEKFKSPPLKIIKTDVYKNIINPVLNCNEAANLNSMRNDSETVSKNFLYFRNLMFATIASIYSKEVRCKDIVFGFIKKNTFVFFPDTSPEFIDKMNNLMKVIDPSSSVELMAPCISMEKKNVVGYGIRNDIPMENTYSCYEIECCYKCESCIEVRNAYEQLQLENLSTGVGW